MNYATEIDVYVDEYCGNIDRCNNQYTGWVVGAMTDTVTNYGWQCSMCDHVNEREGYGWEDMRNG